VKRKNILAIVLIVLAFIAFFIFVYLPMADQQKEVSKRADDLYPTEKLIEPVNQVPAFSFTDQHGKVFSEKDVEGKVYVADFFFTSCDAICPMMNSQLTRVQQAMGNETNYRIVSYSLDPENDSVPVLRSFARKFEAKDEIWHLLTGDKREIYQLGSAGYKQPVLTDSNGVINHSGRIVLVDEQRMIRGFYNALDSSEVDMLINDLSYLLYKEK
jgi:protein SCO1/2